MAEERVILQVKFDQIRATGVGTAATARRAQGISDTAIRANGSTNGANGSSRESIDDLLKRLRAAGENISDLKDHYRQKQTTSVIDAARRATMSSSVGSGARALPFAARVAGTVAAGTIGGLVALLAERGITLVIEGFRNAVRGATEELRQMTENAADLNSAVAAAVSIAERNILTAQRRQAARLEDDLTRLVRARNTADVAIIELKTLVANVIIPKLLPFMEVVTEAAGYTIDNLRLLESTGIFSAGKNLEDSFNRLLKKLGFPLKFGNSLVLMTEILRQIRNRMPNPLGGANIEDELDVFFDPDVFLKSVTKKGP